MLTSHPARSVHTLVNAKRRRHAFAMKCRSRPAVPPLLWAALLLAYVPVACSSTGDLVHEARDFNDAEGRACSASLAKTSQTSPAVSEGVKCDSGAKQCSSDTKACFELSVAGEADAYAIRNCPACCLGTASSFVTSECTTVVCSVNADCIFAHAQCQDGACVCPLGSCG
jgi:hypothetical protein